MIEVKLVDLDEAHVKLLRKNLDRHTRSLTRVYFLSPVICVGTALLYTQLSDGSLTNAQWGAVQVLTGLLLAGWAFPLFEKASEVQRLLEYSGNRDVPELTKRFGYKNIKDSFYALETIFIFFGTFRAAFF